MLTRERARTARGAIAFTAAARAYWLAVHPLVRAELAHWRARAGAIDDPALRQLALRALAKRGNMEGAAAFAAFVPRAHRRAVVRATVAFQAAYNHLDLVSEQPCDDDAVARSAQLHRALPAMLAGEEHTVETADRGYLSELSGSCATAAAGLPGYRQAADRACRAAERIARFQAFNCGERQGDHDGLARWAAAQLPRAAGLTWWESAAAAGSSLGVHVMLAAAARPHPEGDLLQAIEDAYFPWIGTLHSMLDQLIDIDEDERTGQANLAGYYAAGEQARRFGRLAAMAMDAAEALDRTAGREHGALPACHALIVTAMASMYLSAGRAQDGRDAQAAGAVLDRLGPLALPSMATFRLAGLRGARLRGLRARDARFAGGACGERGSARPSGPAPLSRP